jgi:class 3 adenylate cyclase
VPATLICSNCSTENEAGRKFCVECGHRLASACPVCGTVNAPSAKFCGECGNALGPGTQGAQGAQGIDAPTAAAAGERAQTREAPVAERRLVSVLFVDLVGFTTASEQRDAEDTRELLSTYFETAREIVERHGGVIEKFIGDAVMAVWGTPTAHEDDAERAVRTALQLVEAVGQLEAGGQQLQARAGVLTGEAAVTIGATGQGMVAGDLVNTASRLQSAALPGTVLVGEATYRAASDAIAFEAAGEHELKGKEAPVRTWRATAVVARRGGQGRAAVLEPPFVGRDEELRLLKDQFHATAREGKPRLATIVGQAGIGKSRVGWELEKYLDGVVELILLHEGRSPAYGEGISYWALAEMVRGRAGIAESEEPESARAKLAESLDTYVSDPAERRWIEPRLTGLLGLDELPSESREELFAAWRTFFERMAEQATVLLIFWDLQWADQGLLDFIEHLLTWSRGSPIFVLAEARPELFERRPGWGTAVRSSSSIHLDPLTDTEMRTLLDGIVTGLPDQALGAIIDRAEGVPLYAVETLRMLIDRGVLQADGAHYALMADLPELAVPETLHALIAARLDALDPGDRAVLTDASVLGLSFTSDALQGVTGIEPDALAERLARLVKHELLLLDADPRSPERGQHKFIQGVVREVAYQSLAKRDRRARHLAAARYFESLGEDELAGVLANHYLAAYRATPPGPEADALAAQARVALRAAAERATALHAPVGALGYLEQALEVTADPMEQAALHERAAAAATSSARTREAEAHARKAEGIYASLGDRLGVLRSRTHMAQSLLSQHGDRAATAILQQALADVDDLPPSPEIVTAQSELARTLMVAGSPEALAWCDRVLASAQLVGQTVVVQTLITKGAALIGMRRETEAEVVLRGAIVIADRMGDPGASLRARNNLTGIVEGASVEAVLALVREIYEIAQRYGERTWVQQAIGAGLTSSFDIGRWDEWDTEMHNELPDAADFYRAWFKTEGGRRLAYQGATDEADRILSEALASDAVQNSAQALAAIAGYQAEIRICQGRLIDAFEASRAGWANSDNGQFASQIGQLAALAAGDPARLEEVTQALSGMLSSELPTRVAARHLSATLQALVKERWDEARASYLSARRILAETGHHTLLAAFQLGVGHAAADRFPEAKEAGEEGSAYFHERGADAYVAAYRGAAAKPSQATASARSSRATSDAERETEPTTR